MRFVTTCDKLFQPGLAALLNSFVRNSNLTDPQITVIEYSRLDRKFLQSIGPQLTFIPKDELGHFEFNRKLCGNPRMMPNYDKFLVWKLPYTEPCLYLDADTLILNDLAGLDAYDHLTVAPCMAQFGRPPGADPAYRGTYYAWNAGVFVFRPNAEIFSAMQTYAERYKHTLPLGDQLIHNDYFAHRKPEHIHWFSPYWNFSIWYYAKHPYMVDPSQIRILHFANTEKPWSDPPNHDAFKPLWELWETYRVNPT